MIPKYVSAEEYSKKSGMGVEEVKRQCRLGKIQCLRTEKGYYKIPVYENDAVSIEEYNKVKEENTQLKTILKQFNTTIVNFVKNWKEAWSMFLLKKLEYIKSINVIKDGEEIDQIHYEDMDELCEILKNYYSEELLEENRYKLENEWGTL